MIWTYSTLIATGSVENLNIFEKDSGFPDCPFSLQRLVPVPALPSDEDMLKHWGCMSPADIVTPWGSFPSNSTGKLVRFRTMGGPPTAWLRRVAPSYPELTFTLTHVTEATAVVGKICRMRRVVWRTEEVEADVQLVEQELGAYLR